MQKYKIRVEFTSPSLPGAGEGWGSVIDTDVIFDSWGLPYLPARRFKGALKGSALEVVEMLAQSGIEIFPDCIIAKTFGQRDKEGQVDFSNLHLPQYQEVSAWCRWAMQEYSNVLSPEVMINTFTEIRQQTAINEYGVADDYSLRTIRVLKADITFEGLVSIYKNNHDDYGDVVKLLALACANLRQLGTMRNRGLGQVRCSLWCNGSNVSQLVIDKLAREVV